MVLQVFPCGGGDLRREHHLRNLGAVEVVGSFDYMAIHDGALPPHCTRRRQLSTTCTWHASRSNTRTRPTRCASRTPSSVFALCYIHHALVPCSDLCRASSPVATSAAADNALARPAKGRQSAIQFTAPRSMPSSPLVRTHGDRSSFSSCAPTICSMECGAD